jgi:hypothetical protein
VVSDRVEEIVDRTIAHTLTVLAALPDIWPVARIGVQKIHDDLAVGAPDHPALERLRAFIAETDLASGER